jgi:hypothetical protein
VVSLREVSNGMYGAWRLARLDAGAMAWFDRSAHGVWRSFWAMAITYPGFLVLLTLRPMPTPDQAWAAPSLRLVLVESIGYVIAWTAFLLIVIEFCRWIRRERECLDFIIAYNWSQVLQTGLWLAVAVLASPLAPVPAAVVHLAAWAALIGYEWFIARVALGAGALVATAVVLLDLVLAMSVGEVAQSLY